jgi:hypothetical protein
LNGATTATSLTLQPASAGTSGLAAAYEPFGAHSHYGLLIGEHGYLQVAEAVRAFLETNRL